jgi:hypothetical protein
MDTIRKKLQRYPVIKFCASMNITLVCLVLLFILTLWGTIDQARSGLFLAQERFFNSLFFTFGGFIPFPGARLVLWILFINLVCAAVVRLVYRWAQAGIIVTHFGLLSFFVAAFVTFHGTQESNLTLREGEGVNVSSAYHDWDLAVWRSEGNERNVVVYDARKFQPGKKMNFSEYGLSVEVAAYYPNSEAYLADAKRQDRGIVNDSGIEDLKAVSAHKEPEKNIPGGIFLVKGADPQDARLLLYGGETNPTEIRKGDRTYYIQLRRKKFPLPFVVRLKDFMMEFHPNTRIARSYKSLVEVMTPDGASREVLISMNKPLRYKNYTLYQSSYSMDESGRESSTLAVVRNAGRLLPYWASFITFAGLAMHLLIMAFKAKLKH